MMNRRQFVAALAAVTAAAGTGIGALMRRRRVAVQGVNGEVTGMLEGRAVTLHSADGHRRRGVVTDVRGFATRTRLGAPATEQVALRVKAGRTDLPAGIYRLENDDLVLADLYFSPVGPAGDERRLEAVISRIV